MLNINFRDKKVLKYCFWTSLLVIIILLILVNYLGLKLPLALSRFIQFVSFPLLLISFIGLTIQEYKKLSFTYLKVLFYLSSIFYIIFLFYGVYVDPWIGTTLFICGLIIIVDLLTITIIYLINKKKLTPSVIKYEWMTIFFIIILTAIVFNYF